MKAEVILPSPVLQPYIDSYVLVDIDWRQQQQLASVWRLIPYGQASFLFLYGDLHEYSLNEFGTAPTPNHHTGRAFLVGQLRQPIWLKFSGRTRLVKVLIKPAGIAQLLPMNLEEFTDIPSLDLEAVWGQPVPGLLEQLHDAATDTERIHWLNTFLESRLLPQDGLIDYVAYSVAQLKASAGNLPIRTLEDQLGISRRHLERLFRAKVGLTPKELGKIIRLNHAFSRLEDQPNLSMTQLAHESGYFDSAHFSRDFKELAGSSPSRLLSDRSGEMFVTHGRCFTSLPGISPSTALPAPSKRALGV